MPCDRCRYALLVAVSAWPCSAVLLTRNVGVAVDVQCRARHRYPVGRVAVAGDLRTSSWIRTAARRSARRDVVDPIFVRRIVETLELAERAVLVGDHHVASRRSRRAEIPGGESGTVRSAIRETHVQAIESECSCRYPCSRRSIDGGRTVRILASTYLASNRRVPCSSRVGASTELCGSLAGCGIVPALAAGR